MSQQRHGKFGVTRQRGPDVPRVQPEYSGPKFRVVVRGTAVTGAVSQSTAKKISAKWPGSVLVAA